MKPKRNPVKKLRVKNADYQKIEVLKSNRNKRHRYNQFFVEGVRNINEAVRNNWHIVSFLYTDEKPLSGWARDLLESVDTDINLELSLQLMQDLSSKEDTSELLAVVRMPDTCLSRIKLSKNPLLILFDRPSNRGNLGTVIRSCDAFGADGLIITGHAVDLYDPDTVAATAGSLFKLPCVNLPGSREIEDYIAGLKAEYPGFKVVGTSAHSQNNLYDIDLTGPVMLMLGNETAGLSRRYKEICDENVVIPMSKNSSASSLNVACAGTVLMYEVVRQRKCGVRSEH